MELNGSEIIVECLKEQKTDTIFGYPGGAILNVYDALYKHSDEITHILTSHEQGASHAADGYARATGKVGVCFATSGPGATNLVTGIATAYMDSVPMVAITCNVTVPLLGKDSFQEIDITGVTMPITKHNFIVKDVTKLADTIRKAFQIAKEGRPGPVLIDVTKDVTANSCEYVKKEPEAIVRITDTIKQKDIDNAISLIKEAKKPYVFVGGGVIASDASDELRCFVKKIDAPVTDSLMGKGAFDGSDPLYTGMLGMHGTKTSNFGVSECDLLIAVGVRFSDRVTGNVKKFASNAKILQFDIDAAEINKNVKTDASVIGDAYEILKDNMLPPECDIIELYHKSCENLNRDVEFVVANTWYGGFGIVADGHHEASSVCFKHIWQVCADKLEDDLIIMIPRKDVVLFAPAGNKETVQKMIDHGEQAYEQGENKISKNLYRFSRERKELVTYEE